MPSLTTYSLLGNSRSAAFVGKQGAINWCSLPEFHSPPVFSALLDNNRGGYFSLSPRKSQPYQGPTSTKQLQPPGNFAVNYGRGKSAVTMLAHVVYGSLLGLFLN